MSARCNPVGWLFVIAALVVGTVQLSTQEPLSATTGATRERLEALVRALSEDREYVPGEVLVQFRSGVPESAQLSALRVLRTTTPPTEVQWIGDTLRIAGLGDEDPERAAEALERQPEVLFAQPNYIRKLHAIPNDTLYSSQWNMDLIRMPQAWDISRAAGGTVTVAVLDSGFTKGQGTFGFRIWTGISFGVFGVSFAPATDFDQTKIRTGIEFTPTGPWTASGQPFMWDAVGHGTHVAGTVAQQTNNT